MRLALQFQGQTVKVGVTGGGAYGVSRTRRLHSLLTFKKLIDKLIFG